MSGHHQSALLLHAVSETDRHWILKHLPETDQRILNNHLKELQQLGIPVDPSLAGIASQYVAGSDEMDLLQLANANHIRALLADEPVWMVRQILALEAWPWKQDFLALFPVVERTRLLSAEVSPIGPKVAEYLRSRLMDRMKENVAPGTIKSPPKRSGALFDNVKAVAKRWF